MNELYSPTCTAHKEWVFLDSTNDVGTSDSVKSREGEYFTSTPRASVKESVSERSTSSTITTLKAISLWQPYCSLIPLGLKHYETRSWKTKYRGKLLICSTAKSTKTQSSPDRGFCPADFAQYQQYLKISTLVELPAWDEINFPRGCALAVCDLVDCIEMTPEFIAQQSQIEIFCGDWQVGRYAWKLENIQPITEPFAVKGKQGLFNIPSPQECYLKKSTSTQESKKGKSKSSDCWYTPLHIVELVVQVLGQITLDPCADDGKHIPAALHYTATDDGLVQEWFGRVYMNPPYSCPAVWMKKLQAEMESGRVTEAIALVPAATDTKWLSPVLKTQPVCFWKGRIKFLSEDYQPKNAARQSHVLVYWGLRRERFKEVFEEYGVVYLPTSISVNNNAATQDAVLPVEQTSSTGVKKSVETVLPVEQTSSTQIEKQSPSVLPVEQTSSTKRRSRGEGTGRIHWRTITKNNGKQYQQAWYDWQHHEGKTISKSTYIPKRLLPQVQRLEIEKAPVREILQLLGINL